MKKTLVFLGTLVLVFALASPVIFKSHTSQEVLAKCYHGIVGDSNSVFTIDSKQGNQIEGSMAFAFAQKDSSYGTYKGTYENGLMKVSYKFWSEGVESVGNYEFTKVGENFKGSGYIYLPAKDCQKFIKKN